MAAFIRASDDDWVYKGVSANCQLHAAGDGHAARLGRRLVGARSLVDVDAVARAATLSAVADTRSRALAVGGLLLVHDVVAAEALRTVSNDHKLDERYRTSLPYSTPANLKPLDLQRAVHEAGVMLSARNKGVPRRVRALVESTKQPKLVKPLTAAVVGAGWAGVDGLGAAGLDGDGLGGAGT